MRLLDRFRLWLASRIAPKPQSRSMARGDMLDLMERRLDEIERHEVPIAYDPRIERSQPWNH